MAIFAVHENIGRFVSVWRNYDDAYAASSNYQDLIPEASFSVKAIEESELPEFWLYNEHLDLG